MDALSPTLGMEPYERASIVHWKVLALVTQRLVADLADDLASELNGTGKGGRVVESWEPDEFARGLAVVAKVDDVVAFELAPTEESLNPTH